MKTLRQGSALIFTGLLAMSSLAQAGNGALLDVTPDYPNITYVTGTAAQGAVYNGTQLIITGTSTSVTFVASGSAQTIVGGGLALTANINSSGAISGGTFTISGSALNGSTTYGSPLLTGTVADYGIIDIATTDLADFKLIATGGSLLPLVGGTGAVIGMTSTLEGSGFAGSFASAWGADTVRGNVGPAPTTQPFPCYNVSDVSVKNRSGTTNDEVHINKAGVRLPVGVNFNPAADIVTVAIDGLITTIPAGSFVQNGTRQDFTYNTASGVKPKIEMRLNFDKATWEFDLTKGNTALIDTSDGVDVTLTVGIYTGTEHVAISHHSNGHSDSSSQSHPPTCKLVGNSSDSSTPGSGKLSSIAGLTLKTPSGAYSSKTRASRGVSHPNTAYVDEATGELAIVDTSGGTCLQCGQVVTGTSGHAFTIMKIQGRPNDTLARKCAVYNATCSILPPGTAE